MQQGVFLMSIFPPQPKLFSLETFQQYTANTLPGWNSSGKYCDLKKQLGHLAGVSTDLQIEDQKHTVNIFGPAQKEFGDLCD